MHYFFAKFSCTSGALVLILFCWTMNATAMPELVLNSTNKPPYGNKTHTGFTDQLAHEAFRRIGVNLKLVTMPPERGLRNANNGIEDGDLTRIAGLEKIYPNLVRVPEEFMEWDFCAFTIDPQLKLDWPSIRKQPVGLMKGWKIYEKHMKGAKSVVTVNKSEQLFRLLLLGRINIALYERYLGLAKIHELGISGIIDRRPPLAKKKMYIYLNRRHAAYVPKLAKALKEMKKDGFYKSVYIKTLLPYTKVLK